MIRKPFQSRIASPCLCCVCETWLRHRRLLTLTRDKKFVCERFDHGVYYENTLIEQPNQHRSPVTTVVSTSIAHSTCIIRLIRCQLYVGNWRRWVLAEGVHRSEREAHWSDDRCACWHRDAALRVTSRKTESSNAGRSAPSRNVVVRRWHSNLKEMQFAYGQIRSGFLISTPYHGAS